jgi:hypothetical protein
VAGRVAERGSCVLRAIILRDPTRKAPLPTLEAQRARRRARSAVIVLAKQAQGSLFGARGRASGAMRRAGALLLAALWLLAAGVEADEAKHRVRTSRRNAPLCAPTVGDAHWRAALPERW